MRVSLVKGVMSQFREGRAGTRSLRLRGEGILITRSGPRPTLRLGFRLSGSATGREALPGDGFTPRRIFDRLSAAGMTEGRVGARKAVKGQALDSSRGLGMTGLNQDGGWQRAGQGGSRTAPTAGMTEGRGWQRAGLRGRGRVCGYVGTTERAHHSWVEWLKK